jgi:hypothetical protein
MPRSVEEILQHAEELAGRFENYEPTPADELDAGAVALLRAAVQERSQAERHFIDAIRAARESGMSWSAIGAFVGTSGVKPSGRDTPERSPRPLLQPLDHLSSPGPVAVATGSRNGARQGTSAVRTPGPRRSTTRSGCRETRLACCRHPSMASSTSSTSTTPTDLPRTTEGVKFSRQREERVSVGSISAAGGLASAVATGGVSDVVTAAAIGASDDWRTAKGAKTWRT